MKAIIIILVIIFIVIIKIYNDIIKLKKKVQQSYSTIDVYLTQRFDLIPNLVECVKAYTKHESEIFERIAEMRTNYMNTKNIEEAEKLNSECDKLIAYIEKYPDLKASEQYLELQKKLSKIESQLQAARRLYNSDVTRYNTKILVFPNSLIANTFGFSEEKLFEIENENMRKNIDINL